MNIKSVFIAVVVCVACTVGVVSAGEIIAGNGTVHVYGEVENIVRMSAVNDEETNYNKTLCFNATVIEGEISIAGADDYELEYTFIADINDSTYVSRILTISQVEVSSALLTGVVLKRTLTLDGIEISSYETDTPWWGKLKKNTVHFNLIDNNIRFGDDILQGISLAFTQLNYNDQQEYLRVVGKPLPRFPISHKYISVGEDGDQGSLELRGLSGAFYNVFGDTVLTKIPVVGNAIGNFGAAIQGLIFLPLSIVQFAFDFIFTFLIMIKNNWWYSILLLEIICIIPALKYNSYPDIVGSYFRTHIAVFRFMWEVVLLNLIGLILRLIEIIRNMFRI